MIRKLQSERFSYKKTPREGARLDEITKQKSVTYENRGGAGAELIVVRRSADMVKAEHCAAYLGKAIPSRSNV